MGLLLVKNCSVIKASDAAHFFLPFRLKEILPVVLFKVNIIYPQHVLHSKVLVVQAVVIMCNSVRLGWFGL